VIPIRDENPTLRTPIVTIALLCSLAAVWIFVQGAGLDGDVLAASVCNFGLVPGEITHRAPLGTGVPIARGIECLVDDEPLNYVTPLTSMFMHGSWLHLIGNGLFLWVFGNNVEDSMGRLRFLVFYLLCGLAAAFLQVAVQPASPVPMVGASGAIAGVLGGYLILYPRVRVLVLVPLPFFWPLVRVPAYLMLLWWIGMQVLSGLPELSKVNREVSSGVAFFAHIGGFVAGVVLVKLFARRRRVEARSELRREMARGGRGMPMSR
jgi:membrane associated rhomboid family serine protease